MKPLVLASILAAAAGPASSQAPPSADVPPVVVLPIEGPLSESMVSLCERALRQAARTHATHMIVEINTDGGLVTLMDRIIDGLEENPELVTVAYVKKAASAGALIAISCDYLFMAPGSNIGSARPIWAVPFWLPDLPELDHLKQQRTEEEEKIISHFKAHFRAKAQKTHRNEFIAEAMVDQEVVLYEITVDGVRDVVSEERFRALSNDPGLTVRRIREVCPKGQLLNLTASEAEELGFTDGILMSREEVLETLGLLEAPVIEMQISWSEHLASWIDQFKWILIAVGILGIFIELKAPGIGLPGIVGATCFVLFLFGKYLAGLAEITEILLIAAGFVLLAVEIFVVPGTLVAGILGALAVVAGIVLSLQSVPLPGSATPWGASEWWNNVQHLGTSLAAAFVGVFLLSVFLPRIPVLNRVMLRSSFTSAAARSAATRLDDVHRDWKPSVGSTGIAQTPLRPAGKIVVDGRQLDAVTEGQFVAEGTPVRLIELRGNRIVVRASDTQQEPA